MKRKIAVAMLTVLCLAGTALSGCGDKKDAGTQEDMQQSRQEEETPQETEDNSSAQEAPLEIEKDTPQAEPKATGTPQEENEEGKADSQQAQTGGDSQGQPAEDQGAQSRELSQEELGNFTSFVQRPENYGFLLSSYDRPQDVDLAQVLYSGAGMGSASMDEEERAVYEEAVGMGIETDMTRLTTQQIDDFLRQKTGYGLGDMSGGLQWTYLPEYDAYYHMHGDTNMAFFTCTSGRVEGDTIILECNEEGVYTTNRACTLTLKENGGDYIFLSNQLH